MTAAVKEQSGGAGTSAEEATAETVGRKGAIPDNFKPYLFKKGQSGNPAGGKKKIPKDALQTFRDYADNAAIILYDMASNPKISAEVRRKCCVDLMERGYGKLPKALTVGRPADTGQLAPPSNPFVDDISRFVEQAKAKAPEPPEPEVLPPLAPDPFAVVPIEPSKDRVRDTAHASDGRFSRDDGQNLTVMASDVVLGNDSEATREKLREAFEMGVAIGREVPDDD